MKPNPFRSNRLQLAIFNAQILADEYEKSGYLPYDQHEHITHWTEFKNHYAMTNWQRDQLIASQTLWEEAHGHDVRVACAEEFGCKAIGYEVRAVIMALIEAI